MVLAGIFHMLILSQGLVQVQICAEGLDARDAGVLAQFGL